MEERYFNEVSDVHYISVQPELPYVYSNILTKIWYFRNRNRQEVTTLIGEEKQ